MILIFISAVMIMCSVNLFTISSRINGVNKTIINAPMEIFQYSVPISGSSLEIKLYFDQEMLKSKYIEYLDSTIYKFVPSYTVDFRFYDPETNITCRNDCEGVEISFDAPIIATYKFHRLMFYEIKENY